MVVPGISSTALLMVIGTYNNIIYSLSNVGNIINNLNILIPYGIGIFIGIIITSIVINYLFNKYNKLTFSFILGVILSTLVTLLLKIFSYNINIKDLVIGILLLSLGIIISYFFDD